MLAVWASLADSGTRQRSFVNRHASALLLPAPGFDLKSADPNAEARFGRQERALRGRLVDSTSRWKRKKDQRQSTIPYNQLSNQTRLSQYDYTKGQLPELIDVIIEEKASLFVCAVGVPPRWVVDKL